MSTRNVGTQTPTPASIIRDETRSNGSCIPRLAAASGVGAAAALGAAPAAAGAVGFTSGGIAAGSSAATMMSVLGGGATQAGGVVATLQAVGATGTAFVSAPAVLAIGGVGLVVGGLGYGSYRGIKKLVKKKGDTQSKTGSYYSTSRRLSPTYINQKHQCIQTDICLVD